MNVFDLRDNLVADYRSCVTKLLGVTGAEDPMRLLGSQVGGTMPSLAKYGGSSCALRRVFESMNSPR